MRCLQSLHLYRSHSQKESRCFHSGLHSPPGYKAGRIATLVGNQFWGSTKPTCWLDDTLKAEHKTEKFANVFGGETWQQPHSKCVWLWHTWKRIYTSLLCLWCSACRALHALFTQFVCKLELSGANGSGQIQVLPSEQAAGIKPSCKVTFSAPWTLVWTHSPTMCML